MTGWSADSSPGRGYRLTLRQVTPARQGWSRRWYPIAYAIAEVVVGLVYLLGLPAFLWWVATR